MNGDPSIILTGSNGDKVFIFNRDFPMVMDLGKCDDEYIHRTLASWAEIEAIHKKTGVLLENREKLGE